LASNRGEVGHDLALHENLKKRKTLTLCRGGDKRLEVRGTKALQSIGAVKGDEQPRKTKNLTLILRSKQLKLKRMATKKTNHAPYLTGNRKRP
jgi:hypothetical protein